MECSRGWDELHESLLRAESSFATENLACKTLNEYLARDVSRVCVDSGVCSDKIWNPNSKIQREQRSSEQAKLKHNWNNFLVLQPPDLTWVNEGKYLKIIWSICEENWDSFIGIKMALC